MKPITFRVQKVETVMRLVEGGEIEDHGLKVTILIWPEHAQAFLSTFGTPGHSGTISEHKDHG